jgi:hypothetical protein
VQVLAHRPADVQPLRATPPAFAQGHEDHAFALDRAADMDAGTRDRTVLALQRYVGNAAVQALLAASGAMAGAGQGPAVAQRIGAARGHGTPIEPTARERLERSYDADLSEIRVHTDEEAAGLATAVNARAFTSGTDIFFSKGAYAPATTSGFDTLAHETAHVVQQSRGPVPGRDVGGGVRMSDPADGGERAAQAAADRASAPAVPIQMLRSARRPGPARASHSVIQRCGPTPCDCPPEKKAAAAAQGTAVQSEASVQEEPPIQRLVARPSAGIVTIQRSPQPLVPLGDFDLMFNPSSRLDFTPPGATAPTTQTVNDANSTATFTGIPRGSNGTVQLDVAMQWFRKAAPPPQPQKCDLCEILREALTFEIPVPIPLVPNIKIRPPDALINECKKLVRVDPELIRKILDDITDAVLDPCGKLLSLINASGLSILCPLIGFIPGASTAIFAIQQRVGSALRVVRQALEACKKANPGGGGGTGPPTGTGQLAGTARSIMSATFASDKAGQLTFSGLSPAPSQTGAGARLVIPVENLRQAVPTGGLIQQQPTLITTEGSSGTQARLFTTNIAMQPAPADAEYDCAAKFGPFKVGKDIFENEDQSIREIRDFFFGLHPKIRQDVEEGRGDLIITGRASKTDTQDNNLKLGKKRALRVENILRNFTGNQGKLNPFSLGELGAQTQGCPDTPENPAKGPICEDPAERRADVNVRGKILEAGDIEPKCSGHLGEESPKGASNPVTEAEGPETAPSSTIDRPTVRLFSKGEAVRELQTLLNDTQNAGLDADGNFGGKTQQAVQAFQASQGLAPDGIVGPKTWQSLLSVPV